MLVFTTVSGNIYRDKRRAGQDRELLRVPRADLEKSRMRKKTNMGTDIGIALAGGVLRHGDVLEGGKKTIIVEQIPELVASVRLKDCSPDRLVLAGHIIGNRHRPFSMDGSTIYFPIQADSELEVFERLLSDIGAEISASKMVFVPQAGADVRGHG